MPPKDPEKRQAYQREYHQRPEVQAHRREYNRLYREKHREKLLAQNREYHQRPEVKARLAQRARES